MSGQIFDYASKFTNKHIPSGLFGLGPTVFIFSLRICEKLINLGYDLNRGGSVNES